ncbi:MAG: class-II fumarase/aspartase family protein, partial [Methylocystis sp.]
ALARRIGKQSAHRIIHDLARAAQSEACPLSQAIKNDSEVRRFLTEEEIDGLLDARAQIEQCQALVDRVLKVNPKRGVS